MRAMPKFYPMRALTKIHPKGHMMRPKLLRESNILSRMLLRLRALPKFRIRKQGDGEDLGLREMR